jgi:hypothetical protein
MVGDGRVSWCRIFRVGPPCPRLCGSCAVTDRQITDPARRAQILAPDVDEQRTDLEDYGPTSALSEELLLAGYGVAGDEEPG